ncbi:MAG TPA: prepilin-type N-terminal cleavage/methylation domain-containing protein [Candidatus Acidoferrales bacterium]|nr:prepilin-type N-terminal cleavage/methylation domain-containing protein [Candidatus Acidoferrales bacterium]
MRSASAKNMQDSGSRQNGFTLTELAIATAVLLFGVVAVMQLVPFAMKTNTANRYDTTSVVIAQQLLDEMTAQPFTNATVTDPICGVMSLGTGAAGASVASPNATYLTMFNGNATVDFTQAAVAGYNCNYVNPNSATSGTYQVRWGVVVTESAGGQVVSKRFVVGVQRNSMQFRFPVNVGATVQR